MTRHVRRRAATLLLAACTAVLTLVMTAGPALATEGEAQTASGFGTARWDGMILAAGAGVLLGILVFAMSSPGEIHRADH